MGADDNRPENGLKVYYKEIIEQTSDKKSDLKYPLFNNIARVSFITIRYINSMFNKKDQPGEQGWKEWEDDVGKKKKDEEEDDVEEVKPKKGMFNFITLLHLITFNYILKITFNCIFIN